MCFLPCQDRLPVRDEDFLSALSLLRQCRDHLPQSQQRLVDTCSLLLRQKRRNIFLSRKEITSACKLLKWNVLRTRSLSPLVWAEAQRSLPAKSTRLILLITLWSCSSPSTSSVCIRTRHNPTQSNLKMFWHQGDQSTDLSCHLSSNTYLSLSHDQSEDGVRPGAFVIHACSSSSSLFITELKPGLTQHTGEWENNRTRKGQRSTKQARKIVMLNRKYLFICLFFPHYLDIRVRADHVPIRKNTKHRWLHDSYTDDTTSKNNNKY